MQVDNNLRGDVALRVLQDGGRQRQSGGRAAKLYLQYLLAGGLHKYCWEQLRLWLHLTSDKHNNHGEILEHQNLC